MRVLAYNKVTQVLAYSEIGNETTNIVPVVNPSALSMVSATVHLRVGHDENYAWLVLFSVVPAPKGHIFGVKAASENLFANAFTEIDTKRARAMAAITEAQALGFPSEDYADDVNILGQLNMVAEDNRDLLHELQSLTITEDMTLEEAQAVVRKARDMRPWLPWAPQPPLAPETPNPDQLP